MAKDNQKSLGADKASHGAAAGPHHYYVSKGKEVPAAEAGADGKKTTPKPY